MKDILSKQSKDTRCHILSAVTLFDAFYKRDGMTRIHDEMLLDVLSLTKADKESFPKTSYSQIVSNLKTISDPEVRHWVITNTYAPVLRSRRADALKKFRTFCSDLGWDANEIKESMELTEELEELKPIDIGVKSSGSGCLSIIAFIVVCTALFAFALT